MLKNLFPIPAIFLFLLGGLQNLSAQQPDTLKDKKLSVTSTELADSFKKLPARVNTLEKKVAENDKAKDTDQTICNNCAVKCSNNPGGLGVRWWLIFLPVILFFVVGGFFINLILKGKFDLAKTLSTGKTQSAATVDQSHQNRAESSAPVGSTSRLIAFLTGITAILIAVCLITYYAYFTLAECGGNLQFDGMWKILGGLGIGVIPYGVNVWKGNNKETDTTVETNNTTK